MERVEKRGGQASASELPMSSRVQVKTDKMKKKLSFQVTRALARSGLIYIIAGFLLGRANIFEQITPFALPFFAIVFMMKRSRSIVTALAVTAGAFSLSTEDGLHVVTALVFFFLLNIYFSRNEKRHLGAIPLQVFFALILSGLTISYAIDLKFTTEGLLFLAINAALSYILSIIFMQSVPVLSTEKRKQPLKVEEIVCFVIMIASIITGMNDMVIQNISIEHIFSRYFVLSFAFIAGASTGAIVGVVTGVILWLANQNAVEQMSLLAFTGVLGGMLKEGKKVGVSIGLLIATVLLGLYTLEGNGIYYATLESLLAIALFFLTPVSFLHRFSSVVPGTLENEKEQQLYIRRLRDVTAQRVEQFASVFEELSNSFSHYSVLDEDRVQEANSDLFLSKVTEKTCQTCFRKETCWSQDFDKTYNIMMQLKRETEAADDPVKVKTTRSHKELVKFCNRDKRVMEAVQEELLYHRANQKVKQQIQESRKLVADQLYGVSKVMQDFAKEIQKERENYYAQEEQIYEALLNFGVDVQHIDIYSLNPGNIDIEIDIPYCGGSGQADKIIAPMLSDILNENIIVKSEVCAEYPTDFCHVTFSSAKQYKIDVGFATAAQGGGFVSGDSYTSLELGNNKYAVAISDGMGNGERAHIESTETLKLLQKILQSGIDEKIAIKSINSILALRSTDEIFSTLDLAMIDLQSANARFLKVGTAPSFIKRGNQVIKIEAGNLPMGIVPDVDVDVVSEQLKAGDLLIMMSDGVFEGPKHVENYELWMKRKISEIQTTNPQQVADCILEEVIRTSNNYIEDDMTVFVTKIDHNIPKWTSIPVMKEYIQQVQ